jgi:hypothetical protein
LSATIHVIASSRHDILRSMAIRRHWSLPFFGIAAASLALGTASVCLSLGPPWGAVAGCGLFVCFIGMPIAALLVGLRDVWTARRTARRAHNDQCVACGYDLRATHRLCPECGRLFLPHIPPRFELPDVPAIAARYWDLVHIVALEPSEFELTNLSSLPTTIDITHIRDRALALTALGFTAVGDLINCVARAYGRTCAFRVLTSADGRIVAAVGHYPAASLQRFIHFQSELSDGRFVLTTAYTGPKADDPTSTAGIDETSLPQEAGDPQSALRTHEERMAAATAAPLQHGGAPVTTVPIHSLKETLDSQRRLDTLRCEHRRAAGWPTEAQVRAKFARQPAKILEAIVSEVTRLKAQEA